MRIDRMLVHTITLAGLAGMVAACYLLIVLGLGREPTGDEQTLLGLSMVAAAVAALLWLPVRERLTDVATQRVYGERHAPEEVLRTFGSRLTRALPLDELLLQLAESLKKTMLLSVAEVWTRGTGGLERAVSVPECGPGQLVLGSEEESVIARAGVSGAAWARIWLPAILSGEDDEVLRIAPITNSGELLGMIVARRPEGALQFSEADDQALTELARQVGLALHNVKLDSALQESLDEVRRQADELRASRARIVEAGDAQRRSIERDLHDGAQQHLVALAVNVNLARQLADTDPDTAKEILEQIGHELQDAVQELRNLAHGIYPPLADGSGASRSAQCRRRTAPRCPPRSSPTTSVATPPPIEAAVYFCCLEALQNAAKHAGEGCRGEDHRPRGGRRAALRGLRRRRRLRPLLRRAARPRLREHERPGRGDRREHRGGVGPGRGHQDHRSDTARRFLRLGRPLRHAVSGPNVSDERGTEFLLVDVRRRSAVTGVGGQIGGLVGGEQHHDRLGVRAGDPARRLDAVDAGEVDVHEHEPGFEGVGHLDRRLAALGLAHHGEPVGGGDHGVGGTTEGRLIVDDQHRHRGGLDHAAIFPPLPEAEQGATTRLRPRATVGLDAPPRRVQTPMGTQPRRGGREHRVETHYQRLGVAPTAAAADIKAAYRELARLNHPDLANGSGSADMAAVNEAWRVLGDPERRRAYDATLEADRRARERPRPARPTPRFVRTVDEPDRTRRGVRREDWRLDLPITDGRTVQTLGILLAVTGALALAAVVALFTYAILWAG